MHAHLFPWPGRQAGQAGRHTMHLNLMTKLHPCHAQMKLDQETAERSAKTERDRSSHGSPQRHPACCGLHLHARMHSQRKDELPEKLKSCMHACMASPGLAMTGLVQSHEKAATACDRPAGLLSELNRRSGGARPEQTAARVCNRAASYPKDNDHWRRTVFCFRIVFISPNRNQNTMCIHATSINK